MSDHMDMPLDYDDADELPTAEELLGTSAVRRTLPMFPGLGTPNDIVDKPSIAALRHKVSEVALRWFRDDLRVTYADVIAATRELHLALGGE